MAHGAALALHGVEGRCTNADAQPRKVLTTEVGDGAAQTVMPTRTAGHAQAQPAERQVEVRNLSTGEVFLQPYTSLVLAPGAGAIVPPLPGLPAPNVFTVKTVPDSDAIRAWLDEAKPRYAVVVGAGFIGLETAEALHRRGLQVTVVEQQPQVLPALDADMAEHVARRLQDLGQRNAELRRYL